MRIPAFKEAIAIIIKYGVPQSQWNAMASCNDTEQMNRFGTTRARLMELALTAIQTHNDTICLAEQRTQSELDLS